MGKRIRLSFLFFSFIAVGLLTACIQEETGTSSNLVVLTNESSLSIGQFIYITPDPEEKLDASQIAERHSSNLLGTRQTSPTINLNDFTNPLWMVFTVRNQTEEQEWIIDFGKYALGRQGLISGIYAYNGETKTTLVNHGFDSAANEALALNSSSKSMPLQASGFKITLPSSKNVLVVIKIAGAGSFPRIVSPSIHNYKYYASDRSQSTIPTLFYKIALLLSAGFLLAHTVIYKKYNYLVFGVYIFFQLALLSLMENNFLAQTRLLLDISSLLFIAAIFTNWLSTQIFFARTELDNKCLIALVLSSLLIMGSFMVNLFSPNINGVLTETLLLLSMIVSGVLACILSAMLSLSKKLGGPWLTASWVALVAALIIETFQFHSIPTPFALMGNFYWLMVVIQCLLYIAAVKNKVETDIEEEASRKARAQRAEASMARLQQAKESSDQARLLRVIERERELMAELREREMLRTEEMRKAKLVADEANRAKSAFLAVVSHEIRTPMNGIMGMIRLLAGTQITRQQKEYLQTMQTSGETMMALLNDILDFEKIESGNMQLEYISFDMTKLVQDVVTLMTGHAAEKDNQLVAKIAPNFPRTLKGDPTRLRQILLNLVNNAIKFTDSGTVTIHLRAEEDNSLDKTTPQNRTTPRYIISCTVEDTGIGISKEAQETLFTPFTQADKSTARKYGGTGLGLTICRRLVEAMRGRITLQSQEGVGSKFTFTVSLEAGKEITEDTLNVIGKAEFRKAMPMNILVIEDNEMNRRVLKGFLEKDSHTVTLSNSAERALEICAGQMFDVIISDINLGGMNGREFTRNLRIFPNKKIATTPVIALTGNIEQKDIEECYRANMNGYLIKPINPETLAEMLYKVESGKLDNPVQLPGGNTIHMPYVSPPTADPASAPPASSPPEEKDIDYNDLENYIPKPPPSTVATQVISEEKEKDPTPHSPNTNDYIPAPPSPSNRGTAAPATNSPEGTEMNTAAESHIETQNKNYATFNPDLLSSLAGSLPAEQMNELIIGCMDKGDEIIAELNAMTSETPSATIYAKAHELKGMAANFGITIVADIAKDIELAGKEGRIDFALAEIKKLADANRRAREELKEWMKSI